MAILERKTRDPGGKLVDVYPHTPFVSAICIRFTKEPSDDDLRGLVFSVFEEIACSVNRRVRERDLPISLGRFSNRYGDRFVALCLPEVLMVDIHFMFQDAIRALGRIEEISRAAWRDVEARHFGRYANGQFIFYTDPLRPNDQEEQRWEWRSFEVEGPKIPPPRRTPLPAIDFVASPRHDLESWVLLSPQIAEVVSEMHGPSSYGALRRAAKSNFGLQVREVTGSSFPHYGMLTAGWVAEDGCEVTILLRASLPAQLKYVVLAHELAHFVRHFPLVYMNQIAEQVAWVHPRFEGLYGAMVERHLGAPSRLEDDANNFATYLLLPPVFDLDRMASIMFEGGGPVRPEELGWRLLQSLFPDGALNEASWAEIEELQATIQRDLDQRSSIDSDDPQTLQMVMLRALLRRNEEGISAEIQRLNQDLHDLHRDLDPLIARVSDPDAGPSMREAEFDDKGANTEFRSQRRLLLPIDGRGDLGRTPRIPICPTSDNRAAATTLNWRSPSHPSHRGKPVAAWQRDFADHTIVLYPFQRPLPLDSQ
jgi:hypothetical protein